MTKEELLTFYNDDSFSEYLEQREIDKEVAKEQLEYQDYIKSPPYLRTKLYHLQERLDNVKKQFANAKPEEYQLLYDIIADPIISEIKKIRFTLDPPAKKDTTDLATIRAISIKQVLDMCGIKTTNSYNNRLRFSIRNEKIPSAMAYLDQNNWWDYGTNSGGSVIDLVATVHNCSIGEAINKLKRLT